MKLELHSPEEMNEFAQQWARKLTPGNVAYVVALNGDLGAGKTTFTQGVAKALGVTEQVTSPTFVIQKIYPLTNQVFTQLVHIDAYRFNEPKEALALRLEDLLKDPSNLILIEWPERMTGLEPSETLAFVWVDDTVRSVDIQDIQKGDSDDLVS